MRWQPLVWLDPTRVELEVTIADEEFEQARDKAYRLLVRNIRLPGFRPGKVPRRMYEQRFGAEAIEKKASEELCARVYTQALQKHGLTPLDAGGIDVLPRDPNLPGVRLKVTLNILPEVTLVDYTAIRLDVVVPKATEEEIDQAIERLRRDAAILLPVDRPAQLGDVVVIDYAGLINGAPFPGATATNQQLELLEHSFIPGVAHGIVGLSAGESGTIEATFPDHHSLATLAGKTAIFQVNMLEVKEYELPAVDEEFVAKFSLEEPTLAALREALAKKIEAAHRVRIKNEQADPLIEKLLEMHEVPLPPVLIERELKFLLQMHQIRMGQEEQLWEEYLQGLSPEELLLRREEAKRRVKSTLIIEEVARRENITATAGDMETELDELAAQYGQPKERLRVTINEKSLAHHILRSKTLDRMLDFALHHAFEDTALPESEGAVSPM